MIGYVYLTTNTVNGRQYIGKRQKSHFERSYKGSGKNLKLAFKKYGKDKFSTVILEKCETIEELCEAEKKWIAEFRKKGANLYNIAAGGDGGNNTLWDELPLERRAEINKKNAVAHTGERNGFFGKRHSAETRARFSEIRRGIPKSQEFKDRIKATKRRDLMPVLQIDKITGAIIKRWSNWAEAGEMFSAEHGRCAYAHISECCKGTRRSAFGYIWKCEQEAVL